MINFCFDISKQKLIIRNKIVNVGYAVIDEIFTVIDEIFAVVDEIFTNAVLGSVI